MKCIKYLVFLLFIALSLNSNSALALIAGSDIHPTSQGIGFLNTVNSESHIQITNTASAPVTIHYQIFSKTNFCVECDDTKILTPNDTFVLDAEDCLGEDDEGFIVYNAVEDGSFVPKFWNHLIGTIWISEEDEGNFNDLAVAYNAAGRDFIAGTFPSIKPENIAIPYSSNFVGDDFSAAFVSWADTFTANNAYLAVGGTATADGNADIPFGVAAFDDAEDPDSCGDFTVFCADCKGMLDEEGVDENDNICGGATTLVSPFDPFPGFDDLICNQSGDLDGIITLLGFTADSDNIIAIEGPEDGGFGAGFDYAIALGEEEVVPPPVDCDALPDPCADLVNCLAECQEQECEDLDDCADDICDGFAIAPGAVCSGGVATETNCTDEADNDGDTFTDCADSDCDNATACQEEGGGGGGGGSCSIATGSVGLANALLLLIPALGIAIRRRLIG